MNHADYQNTNTWRLHFLTLLRILSLKIERWGLKWVTRESQAFERKTMKIKKTEWKGCCWDEKKKKRNIFLSGGPEAAANQPLFSEKPGSSPRFSSLSSTNPHLFWVIQSPGKQRFLIGLKMPSRKTSQSCLEVRIVLWRHYNHCMARMCTNLSVPQISDSSSKDCCRKEDSSKPTLSVIWHLHFLKLLSLYERERRKF